MNYTSNDKQRSSGDTTGRRSSSRRTTVTPTDKAPPQGTPAHKIYNGAKQVVTQKDGSGELLLPAKKARAELKALNGTDEGKQLTQLTGITWETNGFFNLKKSRALDPQSSDFKKLKPRTVAVYWLATKSYPQSVKKKVEKLHANATKASTKKESGSSPERKETSEPDTAPSSTATSQSTDTPKVDSDKTPPDENDDFRMVQVDGASDAVLMDGKMYTKKQLTGILSGPLPRRNHHRKRRSGREENDDAVDSGSSEDSNGTDSGQSSGRSSRSGRSDRRSRHRRRDDRSGH